MGIVPEAVMDRGKNRHSIEVADASLAYRSVSIADLTPTGQQLSAAAGFKPAQQATVLQMLPNGELEDIRPDEVVDLRYGVLPVIVAIVAHAVVGLGRSGVRSVVDALIAVGAMVAFLVGVHELLVLGVAGALAVAWHLRDRWRLRSLAMVGLPLVPMSADPSRSAAAVSLWRLGLVFLEIGSVLYGSGYVLLAFLQRHLVDDLGWLTGQQLLDAVAVGQFTPGPVFTTATFVGWQVHGIAGAAIATIAIFAPSFVFVGFLGRIVPWMRRRPVARAFLSGVTVASLGLMAGVLVQLADDALTDWGLDSIRLMAIVEMARQSGLSLGFPELAQAASARDQWQRLSAKPMSQAA